MFKTEGGPPPGVPRVREGLQTLSAAQELEDAGLHGKPRQAEISGRLRRTRIVRASAQALASRTRQLPAARGHMSPLVWTLRSRRDERRRRSANKQDKEGGVMAGEKIRIRMEAYDHEILDQSAVNLVEKAKETGPRSRDRFRSRLGSSATPSSARRTSTRSRASSSRSDAQAPDRHHRAHVQDGECDLERHDARRRSHHREGLTISRPVAS